MAGKQRAEDERDRALSLAWHVEAFARQKTLPKLETVLRRSSARPQTLTEQRTMLQILSEQYGIPLQRRASRG